MIKKTIALAAFAAVATVGVAEARDQIRIVGSSTVYPFATTVAENFGKTTSFKTPVIESTGSGGGLKLFCAGVGVEHPDITNASRRIKGSEVELCGKNGVKEITEVKIGYDGIVIANSRTAEQDDFTKADLFNALAMEIPTADGWVENTHATWADVRDGLPSKEIEVMGPPPTSGTRDAFVELVMEPGCEEAAEAVGADAAACKEKHAAMREDGRFIEAGENDNLIVQKLEANPDAFGIFGFSFLDQNSDKVQGSKVEGVSPTFEAIAAGEYGVSRPLFFYVKNAHVGTIPGMKEYIAEFTGESAWGPDGYLAEKGLIPLPDDMRSQMHEEANSLHPLSM